MYTKWNLTKTKIINLEGMCDSSFYCTPILGEKKMVTDEYVHNFMTIGNSLMGKEYALEFPFKLDSSLFEETLNTEQKVVIGSNRVTFNVSPKEQFFFSNLTGSKSEKAVCTLLNSNTKIGIQETRNFQTDKVNQWGWGHVISQELFFKISIKPNESSEWSRASEVFKMNS
jgi:hypothetical protein